MRMSCFRHEDDWGPPEHGSEPSAVCFRLLFGGYCAVWCDVGHGLTARDGRGLALQVVPEKLRTLDHGRPWSDDQFASTRLSSNRDMSR